MPVGSLNPETSEALTAAPVVALYSPIVPLPWFATHRFAPDTAMAVGRLNPETSAALTAAPVMALYSPIVPPLLFVTHRFAPDTAMPVGLLNPETSAGSGHPRDRHRAGIRPTGRVVRAGRVELHDGRKQQSLLKTFGRQRPPKMPRTKPGVLLATRAFDLIPNRSPGPLARWHGRLRSLMDDPKIAEILARPRLNQLVVL